MTTPITIDDLNQAFERFGKGLDGKFKSIDKRFDGMDKRFDGIDERLNDHERRLDFIYVTMGSMQEDYKKFKDKSLSNQDYMMSQFEKLHQENLMRDNAIRKLQTAAA